MTKAYSFLSPCQAKNPYFKGHFDVLRYKGRMKNILSFTT